MYSTEIVMYTSGLCMDIEQTAMSMSDSDYCNIELEDFKEPVLGFIFPLSIIISGFDYYIYSV